jgi:microcystin-dependent protein
MPTTTARRAFTRPALGDAADLTASVGPFIDQVDAKMGSITQGTLSSIPSTGQKDGDVYIARDDKTLGPWGTPYWWDSANNVWRQWAHGPSVGDLKPSWQTADHGAQGSSLAQWLLCDGRSLLNTDYPVLSALIRPTTGGVDGTHFNLPDYRGRVLAGKGTHADVDSLGDSDGLAVASRTPKHQHFSPWPFSENGGAGNFLGAIRQGATALANMGYALRDRITDNSVTEKTVPVGKLSGASVNGDGTSAAANSGNMFNGSPYNDVAAYRDVGSTLASAAYGVANWFIKT